MQVENGVLYTYQIKNSKTCFQSAQVSGFIPTLNILIFQMHSFIFTCLLPRYFSKKILLPIGLKVVCLSGHTTSIHLAHLENNAGFIPLGSLWFSEA